MFRFLSALALGIIVFDLTARAFETRRVWVISDIFLERKTNPLGYWLVTLLWVSFSALCIFGIFFLLYQAVSGSGPYKEQPFFSTHQAWPYGISVVAFGWLAVKIIRDRLLILKLNRPGI